MHFPIIIIDDFLDNPDQVVDFANTLEFKKQDNDHIPGLRTDNLYTLNKQYFEYSTKKALSYYYKDNPHYVVNTVFDKTKNVTNLTIHKDKGILAGVLYLNKDVFFGTNIYDNNLKKTVQIEGIYNRLIMYNANVYHCADSYPKNEDRLTQVFFYYQIGDLK